MRTKLSNTAPHPGISFEPGLKKDRAAQPFPGRGPATQTRATAEEDEGLLHDARNLIGAVGLYCDLLSMPHVLRAEHRHYADELRLLGERGAALIERLIERRASEETALSPTNGRYNRASSLCSHTAQAAEALRPAVECCAGVLCRIAEEHCLEIAYGDAATLPVRVPAESIERILINLVRNAVAALSGLHGSIRIGVGLLPGEAGGRLCPWPFQRVRLTVEDSGCGMAPVDIKHLMEDRPPWIKRHGIGFRVVRELVEVSGGDLTVSSRPGRGTRIEMSWPVAQPAEQPLEGLVIRPMDGERRRMA